MCIYFQVSSWKMPGVQVFNAEAHDFDFDFFILFKHERKQKDTIYEADEEYSRASQLTT